MDFSELITGHPYALWILLLPSYGVYVKPGTGLDYSNRMVQGCFGVFRACPRFYETPFHAMLSIMVSVFRVISQYCRS